MCPFGLDVRPGATESVVEYIAALGPIESIQALEWALGRSSATI